MRGACCATRRRRENRSRLPQLYLPTWAKYKGHPKVFCNIQDDDFSIGWRDKVRDWSAAPDEGTADEAGALAWEPNE